MKDLEIKAAYIEDEMKRKARHNPQYKQLQDQLKQIKIEMAGGSRALFIKECREAAKKAGRERHRQWLMKQKG